MANSYNAVSKYFDIDTGTVTVADLTTLKGSAPASDDSIYISEGATVTIDSSISILKTYQGDNYAGTASTKTGHLIVGAGATLTIFDTTANGGLRGEGTTSTMTCNGTSGSHAAIIGNTASKVSNNDIPSCLITATYTDFTKIYAFYAGAAHSWTNCTFTRCDYPIFFGTGYNTMPAAIAGCGFIGCLYAINDNTSISNTAMDWGTFLTTNGMYFTGNAFGMSKVLLNFASLTRYNYFRTNANSMIAAPTWTTTTGIQTLTANDNLTLSATWGAATDGAGDTVAYRIYIRAGSAPDTFGKTSAYYLEETTALTFKIACTPNGAALVEGTTYHVIVRAVDGLMNEDSNTTSLSCALTKSVPTWNTTTGIQTITDNENLTLTATWGAATGAASEDCEYRIYIRVDEAPDEFGASSIYLLTATPLTEFVIASDATGAALVNGSDYYVIVRAIGAGDEDTNTECLNEIATFQSINISLPVAAEVAGTLAISATIS